MLRRFRRSNDVTGIAFSGGGSRSATQVGALRAIVEAGIKPNMVAGTSAGAVNAVWYALHPSQLTQLEDIWLALRTRDVFPGSALRILNNFVRHGYVHASQAWEVFLRSRVGNSRFEDTEIPCAVVAARLSDGQRVVFDSGELVPAVMASTAVPGVFPPYRIGDEWYVDGGIVEYLPVPTLVERGATAVYALDCSGLTPTAGPPKSVADRCAVFSARAAADALVRLCSTKGRRIELLRPTIPDIDDARDFALTCELIGVGYDHAIEFIAGIRGADHDVTTQQRSGTAAGDVPRPA